MGEQLFDIGETKDEYVKHMLLWQLETLVLPQTRASGHLST